MLVENITTRSDMSSVGGISLENMEIEGDREELILEQNSYLTQLGEGGSAAIHLDNITITTSLSMTTHTDDINSVTTHIDSIKTTSL